MNRLLWLRSASPWLLVLLLAALGCNRGLWTPDEPREGEIAREMALAPSVVPTLDGQPFIEKPPLYYWVVAALFRILGRPSILAARAVSVLAGLGTLLLLYRWLAERPRAQPHVAVLMLATSVQFVISTHWVLLDPLLMLTTTVAAWAAWQLIVQAHAQRSRWWLLYGSLTLALWIKGPIGPLLLGAGLLAYALLERSTPWRRWRPLAGSALLVASVAVLSGLLYLHGGQHALYEWAYVNQVQRLINPGPSGHRQPLLYYAWTLPYAVLPWLPALLQAAWQAAQPRSIQARDSSPDLARYAAILAATMVALLSISSTKRETYLLPALPLLFLWIGVRSAQWWQGWRANGRPRYRWLWWLQVALLSGYGLGAPIAAVLWLHALTVATVLALCIGLAAVVSLIYFSAHSSVTAAPVAALLTAATGTVLLLALAPIVLDPVKNMAGFMRAVGRAVPPSGPLFAVRVDETLEAAVPFYTARALVALDVQRLESAARSAPLPEWVLSQNAPGCGPLPPDYAPLLARSFGGRTIALCHAAPTVHR